MEQNNIYNMIKVGDIEYPHGVSFSVVDGLKFISQNFGVDHEELEELGKRAWAKVEMILKAKDWETTYINEDKFKAGGGFVIHAKISNDLRTTIQFNIFTNNHLVTLTVIIDENLDQKNFIMIGF